MDHQGAVPDRFVAWQARETTDNAARLAVENGWFDGDRKLVREDVTIVARRIADNQRALDFTLKFEATDRAVQIAGTPEGKKGFGGFWMAFATPDGGGAKTVIRTDKGISAKDGVLATTPGPNQRRLQRQAGRGPRGGRRNQSRLSEQRLARCAMTGSRRLMSPIRAWRHHVAPGKPLVLKYRVICSRGKAKSNGRFADPLCGCPDSAEQRLSRSERRH